jgi:SAM-dependent methyltransferase
MQLSEAIELIRFKPKGSQTQTWVDLGCGSGLFTKALASWLPEGSLIFAVDTDAKALRQVPEVYNGCKIEKVLADFASDKVFFPEIDGYLMANSLHFLPNKKSFLESKFESLKEGGRFILVEYDLKTANRWVPYPVTIDESHLLFTTAGFGAFEVLGKRSSAYGNHVMYAAIAAKEVS